MADKIRFLKQQTNAIFSEGFYLTDGATGIGEVINLILDGNLTVTSYDPNTKSASIQATGSGGGGNTNLSHTEQPTGIFIDSSTGSGTLVLWGTSTTGGFISPAQVTTLESAITEVVGGDNVTITQTGSSVKIEVTIPTLNLEATASATGVSVKETGGSGTAANIPLATSINAGLVSGAQKDIIDSAITELVAGSNIVLTQDGSKYTISATLTGSQTLPFTVSEVNAVTYTIPKATFTAAGASVVMPVFTVSGAKTVTIEGTDDQIYAPGSGFRIINQAGGACTLTTTATEIEYRDPITNQLRQMSAEPLVFEGDLDFYFSDTSGRAEKVTLSDQATRLVGSEWGTGLLPDASDQELIELGGANQINITQTFDFKRNRQDTNRVEPFNWAVPTTMYDQGGLGGDPTAAQLYISPNGENYTPPSGYTFIVDRNVASSGYDLIAIKASPTTPDFARHLNGAERKQVMPLGRLIIDATNEVIRAVFSSAPRSSDESFERSILNRPTAITTGHMQTDGDTLFRGEGSLFDTNFHRQVFTNSIMDSGILWIEFGSEFQRALIETGLNADSLKYYCNTLTGTLVPISGDQVVVHTVHLDQYNNGNNLFGGFVMARTPYSDYEALVDADLIVEYGPYGYNYQTDQQVYTETFPSALVIVDTSGIVGVIDVRSAPYEAYNAQPSGVVNLTKTLDATNNKITIGTDTGGDSVDLEKASTIAPGLMSKEDKAKLDSINPDEAKPWGVHEVDGSDATDDLELAMVQNNGLDYILKPQTIQQITFEDVAFPKGAKIFMSKQGVEQVRILGNSFHTFNGDAFFDVPDDSTIFMQQTADTGGQWVYQVNPTAQQIAQITTNADDIAGLELKRILITTERMQDDGTYNPADKSTTVTLTKAELDNQRFVVAELEATPNETDAGTPRDIELVKVTTEDNVLGYCHVEVQFADSASLVPARVIINSFPLGRSGQFEMRDIGDHFGMRQAKNQNGNQWLPLYGLCYPIDDLGLAYAEAIQWVGGSKMLDDALADYETRISANETGVADNAEAIQNIIDNPPIPTRIVNGSGAVFADEQGGTGSVSQGGRVERRNSITHTSAPNGGNFTDSVFVINGKNVDDATAYTTNQFLTPYADPQTNLSIRAMDPSAPAEAVGKATIRCTAVNGLIQARTNTYVTGNVFQPVQGGGENLHYDITGLKPRACTIKVNLKVANNAGAGATRTGIVRISYDGTDYDLPYAASFDGTVGFTDVNHEITLPNTATESTASVEIRNGASQSNMLWTDIAITVEQYWGETLTQRDNVAEDRQFADVAAWVDTPVPDSVDKSSWGDNYVWLDEFNNYRQNKRIPGTSFVYESYLGQAKLEQIISMQAGVSWYRIATAPATAIFDRGFKIATQDGSHSINADFQVGVRARIAGAPNNIGNRQYLPAMIYEMKGAFSYLGGSDNDDPIRGIRYVQEGDSSGNRVIHVDVQLWQDSATSQALILWDVSSIGGSDNLRVLPTDEIVQNPDITGHTVNEYDLQTYTSRNGNSYGVKFSRTSLEMDFVTANAGTLDVTPPFVA